MKIVSTILLGMALIASSPCVVAQTGEKPAAEPVNVLVESFTFTRPTAWRWQPNSDASTALALFVIPNKKLENITDVRFHTTEKEPLETMMMWKGFFTEDSKYDEKKEKIGRHEVIWLSITGVHKSKNKSGIVSRFAGAIVPVEKRYLLIRLYSPNKTEVDDAMQDFEKMIREALIEE